MKESVCGNGFDFDSGTVFRRARKASLGSAKALLTEGYNEMTGELLKITREFEMLDDEAIKNIN